MTDRERRQRRLLAVRKLQADYAAAQVRRVQAQQDKDYVELRAVHLQQHGSGADLSLASEWLMACAEREIASLRADRLLLQIEERIPQIEGSRKEEQARRQAREQMQSLCETTAALSAQAQGRADQATLDDLFNAARHRRLATNPPNFSPIPNDS